jgi:hypothetical protein
MTMRIPLSSANFSAPVYIGGSARNRVSVGESIEHAAKRLEYDTGLQMAIIWPRRDKKVKTAQGKDMGVVGVIVARPDSFDVLEEYASLLEESKPATVKPGQK